MQFAAIMKATPDGRIAKYETFATEALADAHVAEFLDAFSNAFVVTMPPEPDGDWSLDMTAGTLVIDVPPPPPTPPESKLFQSIRALAAEIDAGTTGAVTRIDAILGAKV